MPICMKQINWLSRYTGDNFYCAIASMFFQSQDQEDREQEQEVADNLRNTYDNSYNKQFIIDLFSENEAEFEVNEYVHLQLKTKNMLEYKN